MHAERLNSIASKIVEDYQQKGILKSLDALNRTVQERIDNNDPALEPKISAHAKTLFESLGTSSVGMFPPTWRKLVEELGFGILIPENLRQSVDQAFAQRLVNSDLLSSLKDVRNNVSTRLDNLTKLRDAFAAVGIRNDDLGRGELEFDVAMPREAITDNLAGFSKELSGFNTELRVFAEVSRGGAQAFRINSISTNDFTFAVSLDINLGEILAYVLLGLAAIKNTFRSTVAAAAVDAMKKLPDRLLDEIKSWAAKEQRDNIKILLQQLPEKCPRAVDGAKVEQHEAALMAAIEYFADKQELGFNMDVRTGGAPEEDAGDADDEQKRAASIEQRERFRAVEQRSAELKILLLQKVPIFSLPPQDRGE